LYAQRTKTAQGYKGLYNSKREAELRIGIYTYSNSMRRGGERAENIRGEEERENMGFEKKGRS
jgi:hypothetical protein